MIVVEENLDLHKYQLFSQFLENACGIVLGQDKQYLVRSRLSPLLKSARVENLNTYIDLVLNGNLNAKHAAIEAMTTNETLWFRDGYPFKLLEDSILPLYSTKSTPLRIWSAACSSGQEAYSIAMTILNYKKKSPSSLRSRIEIVGTDISNRVLEQCRTGEYEPLAISRGLPLHYQHDYFTALENNCLKVKPELQAMTHFRSLNLLDSYSSIGQFDIVFCRNVLIYFSADVKKQILQKIAACLQNDGILFLGASESISGLSNEFTLVRSNTGLHYRKNSTPTI